MPLLQRIFAYLVSGTFALSLAATPDLVKTAYGRVPPLSFRTPAGQPAGFTIDVFNEAARRERLKLAWLPAGPSLAMEAALQAGALDIIPAGMVTPDRQRMFYVSAPWWFAELSLLSRTGEEPANLAGKRLALASPIYRFLAESVFPGAIPVPFADGTEAAVALCHGEADGALMMHMQVHDIFFARPEVCQHALVNVTETRVNMELAVIARRGMEVPANRLRSRIDEMALDGTLARLAARYPSMPSSGGLRLADELRASYSRRFWRTIAICALLMLAAGAWFIRRLYRDLRARQRAQAELETSQARLARAHRIASLGDWEIDLATGKVDLSQGIRPLFHREGPESPSGWDTFLCCVAPDDVARVRTAFERAAAGQPIDIYYAIHHPESGRRYVRQNAEPLGHGGHVARLVGTIQDMTEYRQLEQQLQHSQKIESIGQLAGGVAHDFNNLLTVISGYSAMILDALPPGHETREPVEEIAHAAERAAALTRQLLTFSRRQRVQPKIISPNDVVRNIEKMLHRLIGEDVELVLSLDPQAPSILADAGQIEQVVMNLAVNARDAMPNGGKLVIQTAMRRLNKTESQDAPTPAGGNYVELRVTDTGTGMTPDVISRIFEPFFTTKERGKGTGLGLSMVHGIIIQSGGTIDVRSEPGRGTAFEILLPAEESASSPAADSLEPLAGVSGNETVLVVEDEPGVRAFIGAILQSHGYRVLEAGNGREALQVATEHAGPIDVLLTDAIMPEMGGMALADRFAERYPRTAIVHMSGYTDRATRSDITEKLLHKPFTPSVLLQRIRESLATSGTGSSGPAGGSHL